ncbi:parallel beta-helix domain-containing protein [Fulvivirga sp.]|uniref:parallel beta-helix domain-containing protein n=1 Tax=Fulvivirga sp. TaxID=1931237 RepID=UPI0032EB9D63
MSHLVKYTLCLTCLVFASLFIFSCSSKEEREWSSIEKDLQTMLINASDGETIDLPAGNYMFKKSLLIDGKKNVTIKGAGLDNTVLSFAMQEEGAEGIKASNCINLIFEGFTIEDAKGDNIKVTDTRGITFRGVKSQWTGEPDETNGAYAFYPVLSKNVVVEKCIAIGASDAGIYVGQSDSVIIRNNIVINNVAGIESENSRWVEIYENEAHDNTGGILVFDMPGLTQSGHTTRVYKNKVYENNYRNFAPEGNIVAIVPPGTGILLLATQNIEIFNNELTDNRTLGVGIASYKLVELMEAEDGTQLDGLITEKTNTGEYNAFTNYINIHHNIFDNSKWFPTVKSDFGLLFLTEFPFNTPDIVFDGIRDPDNPIQLCINNNGDIKFAELDAEHDLEGLTDEWTAYQCEAESIAPIF